MGTGAGLSSLIDKYTKKLIKEKPDEDLPDQTERFIEMMEHLAGRPKPRILIIAAPGGGKTGDKFIYAELLHKSDLEWDKVRFCWWNAPDEWINKLDKYLPDYLGGHHISINNIVEIDALNQAGFFVMLYMDEASRDMNAKNALTSKAVRFEKALSLFRQHDIFYHGGTQIANVTKATRQYADIRIYKGNSPDFIDESDDSFAKDHKDRIVNLMNPANKKYSYFTSSYSYLLEDPVNAKGNMVTSGKLELDLFKYCPYWKKETDEIGKDGKKLTVGDILSNGYKEVSLDSDYQEFQNEQEITMTLSNLFLKEYPVEKKPARNQVSGWLYRKYGKKFYMYKSCITNIVNDISFLLMDKEFDNGNQEGLQKNSKSNSLNINIEFKPGEDFPEFLERTLKPIDENLATMTFHWADGLSYRDIYPIMQNKGVKRGTVNRVMKQFMESGYYEKGKLNWKLRAGYLFEVWFADRIGGKVADPESHDPDVIGSDDKRYSLKCYNDSNNSVPIALEEFGPSLRWAKENNEVFYTVGYFPKFRAETEVGIRIIEIDPADQSVTHANFKKHEKTQFLTITADTELLSKGVINCA